MSGDLLSSQERDVAYITFNRPDVHNAISTSMWSDIPPLMERLKQRGARVIVFSGAGDSFASGADLQELRQVSDENSAASIWHAIYNCLEYIWNFELPTIAMVHGACIGGGCLLATACDFRIASHSSSFAVPVAKLGLWLDDRTIARVVAAGGAPFAKELLIAARAISAERAFALGYLVDTVDDEGLRNATAQFALSVSRNVQEALGASKRAINNAAMTVAATPTITDACVISSYLSEEFRRRVQSL